MHDDRKIAVLRAIVEDYVATEEPVGSKALVERHGLGVSPATVRNDMAALEEEGFITQPHTSAGRVPTDKGYRLFVDRLTGLKPMSAAERRAIATILDGAVDLDDVVQRSVRLLVTADPPGRRRPVPHALPLHGPPRRARGARPSRLLVVLILSTGRVEQRLVELDDDRSTTRELGELRSRLNRRRRREGDRRGGRRAAGRRARRDGAAWPRSSTPGGGVVRPPLRRADRRRRRGQPGPVRRELRHRRPPAARGARGARRAAQAARRGQHRRRGHRADRRTRGPTRSSPRRAWSPPATARATTPWPPWASWARPGWTTPDPWRRCAPWPATCPGSSTRHDPSHRPPAALTPHARRTKDRT